MPNWTSNRLTLHGDKTERDRFVAAVTPTDEGEEPTIYRTLLPMPSELVGTTSPTPTSPDPHPNWANLLASGEITQEWHDELVRTNVERYEQGQKALAATGYTDWYSWEANTYGVKWGDCHTHLSSHDEHATVYSFETPWGAPYLEPISALFPTLTFVMTYVGEGNEFFGATAARDGVTLVTDDYGYESLASLLNGIEGDEDDPETWQARDIAVMERVDQLEDEILREVLA